MTSFRFHLILLALLFSSACSVPDQSQVRVETRSPEPKQEDLARARSAADALSTQLAEQLFSELDRSGPLGAVEVCSRVAQETARSLSSDTLEVRRVSLRARNPADDPDAWERTQLERLENELDSGSMPDEVVSVQEAGGGQELRYLKPLRIVPPCLTCHGDRKAMDVELVELLEELYPEDRAVGYENGDLRGAVSVRLTLDGVGSSVGAL
jgi:hypothetical protein